MTKYFSFMALFFVCVVGCKSKHMINEADRTLPNCISDVDCVSLDQRTLNCEAALHYMKSLLHFGTVKRLAIDQLAIDFSLEGIENTLLSDSRLLQFHLDPQCFNGLDYRDLFELSPEDRDIIERTLSKRKKIKVLLSNNNRTIITLQISRDKRINQSLWTDLIPYGSDQDTLTDYYLETLGASKVTIDYTKAITGPSRKTISTKNNRLLVVTSINGDRNARSLRSLAPCYFNADHFLGLDINGFLTVFDIDKLDQASIDMISNIIVKIEGHTQLIMTVSEGQIVDFRYN
jgi:hypothetical protein